VAIKLWQMEWWWKVDWGDGQKEIEIEDEDSLDISFRTKTAY